MLVFPSFLFLIALLSHTYLYAAANHPLFPRAGTALMPAKRIDGLLGLTARQFFCDPGYGICGNGCCSGSCCTSTGTCCPYAPGTADCCPGGGCCAPGSYCDGKGCCPTGKVCSGGGGTITIGGGDGGGGGPPPKTTTHKPPPTTTHKAPPPPPPPPTTTHKVTEPPPPTTTHKVTESPPPTTTHEVTEPPPPTTTHKLTTEPIDSGSDKASKNPTPTPAPSGSSAPPSAGPGNQNVWTSVDDTKISWMGNWVSVGSTCNATSKAKRCSGESSLDASGGMLYTFSGYSISMSFASSNLTYSVQINEKTWSFSGSVGLEASSCTYDVVYQVEASTAQLISVKIDIGSNAKRSIRAPVELEKRADSPWHLDVNDFVVQVTDASPTIGPSSGAPRPGSRPRTFIVTTGLTVVLGFIFSLL